VAYNSYENEEFFPCNIKDDKVTEESVILSS
jgi:hypothetical protein